MEHLSFEEDFAQLDAKTLLDTKEMYDLWGLQASTHPCPWSQCDTSRIHNCKGNWAMLFEGEVAEEATRFMAETEKASLEMVLAHLCNWLLRKGMARVGATKDSITLPKGDRAPLLVTVIRDAGVPVYTLNKLHSAYPIEVFVPNWFHGPLSRLVSNMGPDGYTTGFFEAVRNFIRDMTP